MAGKNGVQGRALTQVTALHRGGWDHVAITRRSTEDPMEPRKFPLAIALALAVGALAAGCAQDTPTAETAGAPAIEAAAPVAADHPAHDDGHAQDHDHDVSHAAGVDFPVPDNHVKWEPDAPLVEGMSRVRGAIDGLGQSGDEAAVLAGAAEVDAAIEYMFENCSLPVEPDVALHAVLARLMAATQALNADPSDTSPVHDMHAAVDNYEALFDDPNA